MSIRETNKVQIDTLVEGLLFLHIVFTYCFSGWGILATIDTLILLVFVAVTAMRALFKHTVVLRWNACVVLTIAFVVVCFSLKEWVQGGWSARFNTEYQTAISVLICTMTMFCVYSFAKTPERRMRVFKYIALAGVYLAIETLLLFRTDIFQGLHTSGMTSYLARYGLQSNQMGACFGISFIVCICLYNTYKTRKYVAYGAINLLFIFLTGSRKALIYALIGIGLYYVLSGRKTKWLRIFLAAGLCYLAFLAVTNIPVLYNLVGKRIISLLDVLQGGTGTDTTSTRFSMVTYGIEWFKENIWFGHGLNAFSVFYGNRTGNTVYSHNNYVELLVSGGIVLTALYYSRFLVLIRRLYSRISFSEEAKVCIVLAVAILVADIASITYYYRIYYIVFGVIMAAAYMNDPISIKRGVEIEK